MEFDEVLEHVGDIGVYQVTLFLMLGAFEFMTADVVAMNFIAGYQEHWCEVSSRLLNWNRNQNREYYDISNYVHALAAFILVRWI